MTPDEIAQTILIALTPVPRSTWDYEVGPATAPVALIFRSTMPTFLDIRAVAGCFSMLTALSYEGGVGDERDEPCIVFQGIIGGKLVQAVFVLNGTGG
jgi:hypothetical protein